MHPVANDHLGTPSPEKPLKPRGRSMLKPARTCGALSPPCLLDGCRSPLGVHGLPETPGQPSRYQMGQVLLGRGGVGPGADPVRNHSRH